MAGATCIGVDGWCHIVDDMFFYNVCGWLVPLVQQWMAGATESTISSYFFCCGWPVSLPVDACSVDGLGYC